jgi:SET domain-containing protein
MQKAALLEQLRNSTYATLKPSATHGIGVFAVQAIPKGCRTIFSTGMGEYIPVSKAEVEALPTHSRELIENFCLFDEDHYFVPDFGFKLMDLSVYLNHSATPNLISVDEGEFFEASRDIAVGEELFVDYGTIVDSEE